MSSAPNSSANRCAHFKPYCEACEKSVGARMRRKLIAGEWPPRLGLVISAVIMPDSLRTLPVRLAKACENPGISWPEGFVLPAKSAWRKTIRAGQEPGLVRRFA